MLTILHQIEQGKVSQAYLSALSYTELISGYIDEEISKRVQLLISHFPNLTIVPLDVEVAEHSAAVQRKLDISFHDAVLVATALKTKSDMIITGVKLEISVSGIDWVNVDEYVQD